MEERGNGARDPRTCFDEHPTRYRFQKTDPAIQFYHESRYIVLTLLRQGSVPCFWVRSFYIYRLEGKWKKGEN